MRLESCLERTFAFVVRKPEHVASLGPKGLKLSVCKLFAAFSPMKPYVEAFQKAQVKFAVKFCGEISRPFRPPA